MHNVFLMTGSNVGDRVAMLRQAGDHISEKIGRIIKLSSFYETEPWGFKDKTAFVNQALEVLTGLAPMELLEQVLRIERLMGRTRDGKGYKPRQIDIDILFYDDLIMNGNDLVVPHPRIRERQFVLIPLAEIAKDLIHPVFRKPIQELLVNCSDNSWVRPYK